MTPHLLRVGLLGGLAILGINGCGGVCGDDGFEWKQDENGVCRPATQTATGTGSTDAATTAVIGSSTGATDPTTGSTSLSLIHISEPTRPY